VNKWKNYIESNQDVLNGKPSIKGTRLSVEFLVGLFASGWTKQQVLENYPNLTDNHLLALFSYVQDCIQDGLFFSFPKKSA